jgi:prephenate dehydrogenase
LRPRRASRIGAEPPIISIIGLDATGVALGHALQAVKTRYEIRGHDPEPQRTREACAQGAIDRSEWNLLGAAAAADLIVVNEPLARTLETIGQIAPHLRDGSLVTDTVPTKAPVLACAAAAIRPGVSFVGGHPILGPPAHSTGGDRFQGATYCLMPLPTAAETAVKVLVGLVLAIGAQPYFIDAEEHDALVAGVDQMPELVQAVILRVLAASPSARDLRRLLGPALDKARREHGEWQARSGDALRANRRATLHWLDEILRELAEWRAALAEGDWQRAEAMLASGSEAIHTWPSDAGQSAETSAMQALEEYHPARQAFLGRLGRRPRA